MSGFLANVEKNKKKMAKIHQNNVRSLILERNDGPTSAADGHHHFRLWTAFSGAAFRRKIFDAVSCGGSSRYGREILDDEGISLPTPKAKTEMESRGVDSEKGNGRKPEKQKEAKGCVSKSEKLLDLLNLAEGEAAGEIKKKEEALEELKIVVKDLQSESEEQRREAASKVRSLAKENSETRVTLAMLGAIPPLAGMLDFQLVDSQISALYALLNLGIGNDL